MLTLDQIKAAHGPKEFTVNVPGWGGDVRIKRLSAQDYIDFIALPEAMPPHAKMAWLCERSLIDDTGNPLIDDASRYLVTDNPLTVSKLGIDILRLNQLEGGGKNLTSRSGDSPTGSV